MLSINSYVNFNMVKQVFKDLMCVESTKEILSDSLYKFLLDYNKNSIFKTDILTLLVKDTVDKYIEDQDIQFNFDSDFLKEEIELTFEDTILDYIDDKLWDKCLTSKLKECK